MGVMFSARGYFHIRGSGGGGGLDLTSSLEAKFGARSSQVHQLRGKTWKVLLPQDAKVGKESQFWGHFGLYLKFKGKNFVTYILGGKIWGSDTNFRDKFWSQALPRPPNMEVPPGCFPFGVT